MGDTKISALPEQTAPTPNTYLVTVDNGTNKKLSTLNLSHFSITDLYINTFEGSDVTGDGTSDNPYATLSKALSDLPDYLHASCTIHVASGTYAESIEICRFQSTPTAKLIISGDTTAPANVIFTGSVVSSWRNQTGTSCVVVEGPVYTELEGITINVTSNLGMWVRSNANIIIDRCVITGTIETGIWAIDFSYVEFRGNITISGWSSKALGAYNHVNVAYTEPGTITMTGPASGTCWAINLADHSNWIMAPGVMNPVGLNITITGVVIGIQLGLNSLFQHLLSGSTLTIDNASTPANSAGVQCTDLSSFSTNQAMVIDNFTYGYQANSISYIEAQGSRTLTNVGTPSNATQNSVIYLP